MSSQECQIDPGVALPDRSVFADQIELVFKSDIQYDDVCLSR